MSEYCFARHWDRRLTCIAHNNNHSSAEKLACPAHWLLIFTILKSYHR